MLYCGEQKDNITWQLVVCGPIKHVLWRYIK